MVFQSPAHVERVTPVGLCGSAPSHQASGAKSRQQGPHVSDKPAAHAAPGWR